MTKKHTTVKAAKERRDRDAADAGTDSPQQAQEQVSQQLRLTCAQQDRDPGESPESTWPR